MHFPKGHDTTAAAISWTILLLGLHPEVQDKVQQEVDEFLGKKNILKAIHAVPFLCHVALALVFSTHAPRIIPSQPTKNA